MTEPTNIPYNVFADGELTNESSWFSRIFTKVNDFMTWVKPGIVDSGWITSGIVTPSSAATLNVQNFRKMGRLVFCYIDFTMKVALGAGNIGNTTLGTVTDSRFIPSGAVNNLQFPLFHAHAGDLIAVQLYGASNTINAVSTFRSIAIGDRVSLTGFYPVDNDNV